MKIYEHKQSFSIKYRDVNFKDEWKMSSVLSHFEQVAADSAEELGYGYSFLKPKGYAFMVSNLHCEFLRAVRLDEKITLKTWTTPPSHVIFGREYRAEDSDGGVLLNASSRWCLADMSTGKILPAKVIDNQDYSTYNPKKALDGISWQLPKFLPSERELKFSLQIANSEYDRNMHVNNAKYADYCLNCFSVSELRERSLKSFAISYARQCREGDCLRFYLKSSEGGVYFIQGLNEKDEVVVSSRVTFFKDKP